jgi:tRNA-Thr(GGU) m(6)t(6)A37 methyltransferase TsaA
VIEVVSIVIYMEEIEEMTESDIILRPIGEVASDVKQPPDMPLTGKIAIIRIYPEFTPALYKLEENSHLWILSWLHLGDRNLLRVAPARLNRNLPERGVFGLRAFGRPNPIGLSLVMLLKVDDSSLHVSGLDAIGGTKVVDIKPYFEQDIIFSPGTPYLRPESLEMRREMFWKEAVAHHQEECVWLKIGVRMALVADERFGKIQSSDLKVEVTGPECLADVLQGLTRARLANPPRFVYRPGSERMETRWIKGGVVLTARLKKVPDPEDMEKMGDDELFEIEVNEPTSL